jgi:SAM-dependent methyltransferase
MSGWSQRWSEPRFAFMYDELYPAEARVRFFVELAHGRSLRILDIGCGTGRVACELARRGHDVLGVDPGPVMLKVARHRPGAERVGWIEASAGDLSLATRFDLAIMTGHVFQVFSDDDEASLVLRNIRRHLLPGGRISFETRNPTARIWEGWRPEKPRRVESADLGVVESYRVVRSVEGEFVTYEHHLRFGDEKQVNMNTIRFTPHETLARLVEAAGFTDVAWYGDWDQTPVTADSPELIVVGA